MNTDEFTSGSIELAINTLHLFLINSLEATITVLLNSHIFKGIFYFWKLKPVHIQHYFSHIEVQ